MMKARVSLNLPRSLKAAAEDWARQEGVSLNQFIACALAEKVGAHMPAALPARMAGNVSAFAGAGDSLAWETQVHAGRRQTFT